MTQSISPKSAKILIVDDIEENRSALSRRLERMNYRFSVADGGRAALTSIETERPDLVLLDFMMPDMSGIEVVRELRARSEFAELPVIMVTARTDPESVVESLSAGANDYVTKPIDFKALGARIESQLTRLQQSEALKTANSDLDWKATSRAVQLDELHEQLSAVQDQNEKLATQLKTLQTTGQTPEDAAGKQSFAPVDGNEASHPAISIDVLLPRLKRIEMLATRLSATPSRAGANPAILAEIASLARTSLADLDNGSHVEDQSAA